MKLDCDCSWCKNEINQYFCGKCRLNFNLCEAHHEALMTGMKGTSPQPVPLCPICNPKDVHWSQTEKGKQEFLDILNESFAFKKDGTIEVRCRK